MSHNKSKVESNQQINNSFSLDRRRFMKSSAAVGAGMMLMQPNDILAGAIKKEKEKVTQAVSEHARPATHDKEIFDLPRWKPSHTGNYNLNDPRDNHFAFAKAHASLGGEYSWMGQYGWIVLAPPEEPAYPILGRLTLAKYFVTKPDTDAAIDAEYGKDDYLVWGTFTTTHVDPRTFKAVSEIYNPYIDRVIDVPTLHYADRLMYRKGQSIIVPGVPPEFYNQPWDEEGGYSQHNIDAGHEVSYTVLGSSQQDGPHQPRCDIGFWSVNRKELMDPSKTAIETRRDYSATMKVSEYAWYGVEQGDASQLLIHLTGLKTHSEERLPSFVRSLIVDRFPERFK